MRVKLNVNFAAIGRPISRVFVYDERQQTTIDGRIYKYTREKLPPSVTETIELLMKLLHVTILDLSLA